MTKFTLRSFSVPVGCGNLTDEEWAERVKGTGKRSPKAGAAPIPAKVARRHLGRALGKVSGYGAWLKR